ncbi:MFS transporter [Gammaproteobacteria bacterium]|nr:MFS transporter [Gammaproteobacteria bacterium]
MIYKLISIFLLGFTSGLPYILVFSTIGIWLATLDISISSIAMFSSITIIYALKIFWAPLVDSISIPFLHNIGNRKGWISLMHILIILILFLISFIDPEENIILLACFVGLIALFGSFQDIAVDAYRIELADIEDQGLLAGLYQYGYRLAMLFATTGALLIATRVGWTIVFKIMAASMLLGFIGLSLTKESNKKSINKLNFTNSILNPLKDIFNRFGLYASIVLMTIIATYRLTDIVAGSVISPFYYKIGYSLDEIALVAKTTALLCSMIGILAGGFLVKVLKIYKALILGALLMMITNLGFAYLAVSGKSLLNLSVVVGLDSITAGIVGTVNIVFLTSLVSKEYTAFQYALFTSLMAVFGKILSFFSGIGVDQLSLSSGYNQGWMMFFIFTSLLTLPSMLLILFYKNKYAKI